MIQLAHAEVMQVHSMGNYLLFAFFSDLPSTVLGTVNQTFCPKGETSPREMHFDKM